MKHKPTVLSLVLRVVTGDFTWLYKSYSYIQGGPGDSNQQSHGSPDTDMKPTSEPMKEQNLKYFITESKETTWNIRNQSEVWSLFSFLMSEKVTEKEHQGFLIRTSFYSIVNIFCS